MAPKIDALVWFTASVLVVSACALVPGPSASPAAPPGIAQSGSPATGIGPSADPDWSVLPLDPASRELLSVMDPAETAHVAIGTTWTDELSRAARGAGMRVEVFEPGTSLAIDGPVGEILALVETAPVTGVNIQDSVEALRPIPDERPVIDIPSPGRPYLVTGFVGLLDKVTIGSPQREAMLSSLAQTIQSIDGQPYVRIDLEGGCGSDKTGRSCGLIAVGLASGSVGREDEWSLRATERAGWQSVIESVRTTSVPRPLVRAAEWIARHDDAALARIRTYTGCCAVSWDPARPGRITLVYDRLCATAIRPGHDLAETGICMDELAISVDLAAGTVVSIDPPARA